MKDEAPPHPFNNFQISVWSNRKALGWEAGTWVSIVCYQLPRIWALFLLPGPSFPDMNAPFQFEVLECYKQHLIHKSGRMFYLFALLGPNSHPMAEVQLTLLSFLLFTQKHLT